MFFGFERFAGITNSHFHLGFYSDFCFQAICWYSEYVFSLWILKCFWRSNACRAFQIRILDWGKSSTTRYTFPANPSEAVEQFHTWSGFSNQAEGGSARVPRDAPSQFVRQTCFPKPKSDAERNNAELQFSNEVIPYTPNFCILPNSRSPPAWGSYL